MTKANELHLQFTTEAGAVLKTTQLETPAVWGQVGQCFL